MNFRYASGRSKEHSCKAGIAINIERMCVFYPQYKQFFLICQGKDCQEVKKLWFGLISWGANLLIKWIIWQDGAIRILHFKAHPKNSSISRLGLFLGRMMK